MLMPISECSFSKTIFFTYNRDSVLDSTWFVYKRLSRIIFKTQFKYWQKLCIDFTIFLQLYFPVLFFCLISFFGWYFWRIENKDGRLTWLYLCMCVRAYIRVYVCVYYKYIYQNPKSRNFVWISISILQFK